MLGLALRACRTHFAWALAFSALVNLLYLAPTIYMMQVYDRVVPTGGVLTLAFVSLATMFALATLAALDWLRTRLLMRAGLRLESLLAAPIMARILDAPKKHSVAQGMRDFDNVRTAVSGPGILALFDAPWTPLYLACCFILHPAIGLLTLSGGALLFALAVLNERDSRPRLRRAILSTNAAHAAQEAIVGQNEVIHALGMRQASINRQVAERRASVNQYADAQLSSGRYSGAIKFVRLAMQSLSLGLAAFLAVKGHISPGSIIAASVLLSRAVSPIELLVGAWPNLVQARTSWNALVSLFESTSDGDRPRTALPSPRGHVQLEGVTFRFDGTEAPQLKQVNLEIKPGETLGIVGPSGSGKTTLARILAGALAPTLGTARLSGAAYDAWPSDELGVYIGYLPQHPSLFAGSIRDNISRFAAFRDRPPVDIDARTVAAAEMAGAHELILRLPQGYDTILGPFGAGVSAGQAQRIALARAMYGGPALIVLDEPNSNLDHNGESALMSTILASAAAGAAVVVVAHRAGVLARVDRLITMQDGIIQLNGQREDVLAKIRNLSEAARVGS